jgi:hypothetical protein
VTIAELQTMLGESRSNETENSCPPWPFVGVDGKLVDLFQWVTLHRHATGKGPAGESPFLTLTTSRTSPERRGSPTQHGGAVSELPRLQDVGSPGSPVEARANTCRDSRS